MFQQLDLLGAKLAHGAGGEVPQQQLVQPNNHVQANLFLDPVRGMGAHSQWLNRRLAPACPDLPSPCSDLASYTRPLGDAPHDPRRCVQHQLDGSSWPEWAGVVSIPAGVRMRFKFATRRADGSLAWESGEDRSFTVPTGAPTATADFSFRR